VPFTSVTLEYEPAPHPDDIVWANMHLPRWRNELPFWFFALILAAFTLAIVTPTFMPQVVRVLSQLLHKHAPDDGKSDTTETKIEDQFASLLTLFINRALLPFPIQWIVMACKFRRKTEAELRQMHLNFWFLIIHAWIAPLLGMAFLQHGPFDLAFVPCVALHALLMPKRWYLGYLFDVTFLTNLYRILCGHLFHFATQMRRRISATNTLDLRKRREHRQYPFGFEYAWTLSMVTLGLCISASVPSALLIVAIYCCIKIIVEWLNIRSKVYQAGWTQEAVFYTEVVFYMRLILSLWWISSGFELWALCTYQDQGCKREVKSWLFPACIVLVSLACAVLLVSFLHVWYKQALRRFIPGRLQAVDDTEEDNTQHGELANNDPARFESVSIRANSELTGFHELNWDARPAFQSSGVEATVDLVKRRPDIEGVVRQALQQGTLVDLSEERLLRPTRSTSCPRFKLDL